MFRCEEERCNIWNKKCKPTLNRGEKWCPECNGAGCKFVTISFKRRNIVLSICILCEGKGKVDWIKAITRKSSMKGILKPINMKEARLKCSGHLQCKNKLKRLWQEEHRFSKTPFYPEELESKYSI